MRPAQHLQRPTGNIRRGIRMAAYFSNAIRKDKAESGCQFGRTSFLVLQGVRS